MTVWHDILPQHRSEDLGAPTISLIAKPPQELENFIDQEERQIRNKREFAKRAIHELQSVIKTQQFALPKIVFVPQAGLEAYMYKQGKTWNESINKRDGIHWGFQDRTFVANYSKWIDWYWESGLPEIRELRLLSNEVAEQPYKKKFAKRRIRFWDQTKNFTATTWIMGDYVILIVTSQKPNYLVEINDVMLAHNLREVFKGIWNAMGQSKGLKRKSKKSGLSGFFCGGLPAEALAKAGPFLHHQ